MKRLLTLPFLVFFVSFMIGLVLFFPFANLRYPIISTVRKSMNADLQIGHLWLGTGFGLGFSKGGLIGLHASNVVFTTSGGASLKCEDFTLSPHFLSVLTGKLSFGIGCQMGAGQSFKSLVEARPLFSPDHADVSAELKAFNLASLEGMLPVSGSAGIIDGDVALQKLSTQSRSLPHVTWDIQGRDVSLPSVESDYINLPSLPLGKIKSAGTFESGKLHLESLVFGNAAAPMEGNFQADLGLDRSGQPVSGELKGKLRTDPAFESTQLAEIKLDLIFGKVKASGRREFTKKVNGNVLSLLMAPPVDDTH